MAPFWTGGDTGTFHGNGLDLEIVNFDGGTRRFAPLLAREVRFIDYDE
jgi:hypothetical protein